MLFSRARCTQPEVLPKPGARRRGFAPQRDKFHASARALPPAACRLLKYSSDLHQFPLAPPVRQRLRLMRRFQQNSETSKPMPPAPITATRSPTGAPRKHFGVGQHLRRITACNFSRRAAQRRSPQSPLQSLRAPAFAAGLGIQAQFNAGFLNLHFKIADGFMKFLFARITFAKLNWPPTSWPASNRVT